MRIKKAPRDEGTKTRGSRRRSADAREDESRDGRRNIIMRTRARGARRLSRFEAITRYDSRGEAPKISRALVSWKRCIDFRVWIDAHVCVPVLLVW